MVNRKFIIWSYSSKQKKAYSSRSFSSLRKKKKQKQKQDVSQSVLTLVLRVCTLFIISQKSRWVLSKFTRRRDEWQYRLWFGVAAVFIVDWLTDLCVEKLLFNGKNTKRNTANNNSTAKHWLRAWFWFIWLCDWLAKETRSKSTRMW